MKPRHAAALALIWCCIVSPSQTRAHPTLSIWPALSGSDIDEWANNLRPYKVTQVGITCNKGDEDVAHAISKAMKQAGWPTPSDIYVPEGPVGTGIAASTRSAQAASALQALFEKQFGLRVEVKEYPSPDGFVLLYIGIPAPRVRIGPT